MAMDSILIWNEVALRANLVSHTDGSKEQNGPTLSSRALAIAHLAMYDAYAGVIKNPAVLPAYLSGLPPAPAGSTTEAAVAAAAHKTLSSLFPSQKISFDNDLAIHGDPGNPGHGFGETVGQAILDDRMNDPGAGASGYIPKKSRGKHRPDPDNPGQGFHGPFYGAKSKGFAITNRHVLKAPPLDNGDYQKALRQVRVKGIQPELMGTLPATMSDDKRTPEETLIGIYWAYDGTPNLGTPPRLYNQIIKKLAIAKDNPEADNARLFAFVNAAMGDAGILCWDQKYIYEFWRPVLGIREHDMSFGPEATQANNEISKDADPFWLPLGSPSSNALNKGIGQGQSSYPFAQVMPAIVKNFTPPFPAYPSGHATFGAAAFHITRLFYGVKSGDRKSDKLLKDLDFTSDELNGMNQDNKGTVRPNHRRDFNDGLWQMILENGLSRIFLGVHWSFDAFAVKGDGKPDLSKMDVGGVPLGLTIAEDIFMSGGGKAPKKSTVAPRP